MKKKSKISVLLLTLATIPLTFSCEKEVESISTDVLKATKTECQEAQTVLGSQIEDPYKWENMKMAASYLNNFPMQLLEPTDIYVKVYVTDDDVYDEVTKKTSSIYNKKI